MPTTLTAASNAGLGDRHAHVGLRGQVDDRIGARLVGELLERLADVVDVQRRRGRHVLALAVREVVDDVHFVAAGDAARRRRASR